VLECVVNVSEGRRGPALDALVAAGGADVLDVHVDRHHHRCVLTLVGEGAPRAVARAAVANLDLRRHSGAHPRLGVVDVVPFIALDEPAAAAWAAADRFARWLADDLGVPAFRYGDGWPTLPEVRRQAFRALRPTTGPAAPHPTAGATAVGSRPPLVAYNVWLADAEVGLARAVARAVRGPAIRALGLAVGDRVQVSMNLVDPTGLGPAEAFDAVAARCEVAGAELVGLVPEAVLAAVPRTRWPELDLAADRTVEARLARRASAGAAPADGEG
jgi:glutamate formiminotransferase